MRAERDSGHRIGEAAAILGVRIETLRRWEAEGRLKVRRSKGGQRVVPSSEVAKLLKEKRRGAAGAPIGRQSARNRFPGTVTEVKVEGLVATVEIIAGPHRILALTTREAVEEMGLRAGMPAVAAIKATNVVVELPA